MWDLIVSVPDHCLSFYFNLFGGGIKFHSHMTDVPTMAEFM